MDIAEKNWVWQQKYIAKNQLSIALKNSNHSRDETVFRQSMHLSR
jgi:hypothetical protein